MINIIGLGYIGLPTALMFASAGNKVVGTDINERHIKDLENGILYFKEKGMEELFEKALANNIQFSTKPVESDIYIVTVPTPYINETKKVDMTYVINAVESILKVAKKGTTLVIESTISPGAIDNYVRPHLKKCGITIGKDIHLVHAPERILPGNMIYELEHNSRTIGADDYKVAEKIKKLYESFCKAEIVITDIKSAEMSKVIENTFRDINIAFANELAIICREAGLDVYEIIKIANKHPRVNILQPGPGVGGHCISVDPWFLIGDYPKLTRLIGTARNINDGMPYYVFNRIRQIMKENNIKKVSEVGLYGLSYKENVDDTRESPTLQLLEVFRNNVGEEPIVYDPFIEKKITQNQLFDLSSFLKKTKLFVIMVSHRQLGEILEQIKDKVVFDTKNVIESKNVYKL